MSRTPLLRIINRVLSQAVQEEGNSPLLALNRRDGLKIGAVSAMALYLNACKTTHGLGSQEASEISSSSKKSKNDIVIVGGGAAGLSASTLR